MAILGKSDIVRMINRGEINGAGDNLISPASLDFRLAKTLLSLPIDHIINTKNIDDLPWEKHTIDDKSGFILQPNVLYLGSTIEELNLPSNVAARADGKSTIGRLGLAVHITAGFIDPGFKGTITLEMISNNPIVVHEGLRIGQFTFQSVTGESREVYKGRYQNRQNGMPCPPKGGGIY